LNFADSDLGPVQSGAGRSFRAQVDSENRLTWVTALQGIVLSFPPSQPTQNNTD
jgi:hypothetical protein